MRPGTGSGKSDERRPTSRIGKPATQTPGTARRTGGPKPATSRINAASARESEARAGRAQQQQAGAPQEPNKTPLYLGIGGGVLVLGIVIAIMMSGGSEGGHGGGGNADKAVVQALSRALEAEQRGEYRKGLDICDTMIADLKGRKTTRLKDLQATATRLRGIINLDRDGQLKTAEFAKKIEAAKADQTAMKKAKEFWDECNILLGAYQTTSAGKQLRDIKEDLRRWVATEGQGDWQKDYNLTKARIEKSFLSTEHYSEGIREWQRFGEISQDPLLHSRIEQEIRTVNQMAQASAEKVVTEAGTGADARTKLEEAQAKYNGTEGQAVINKALKSIK